MLQLSKRMQAVADLAEEVDVLADVGTDHAYIPIYMAECGKLKKAIAMDINQGPLMRARDHIQQYGVSDYIETRLSDGLNALKPGEADTIVIAGMGGALMERILTQGETVAHMARRLVLQPQSELLAFRCFLLEHGYQIVAEDMVYEENKFYTIMAAKPMQVNQQVSGCCLSQTELKYGPLLIQKRHPVLKLYLQRQQKQKQEILEQLSVNAKRDISRRRFQVEQDLAEIEKVLQLWKEQSYEMQ